MFSPADAVTTRRLQIARRSAERKTKPRRNLGMQSQRSDKRDVIDGIEIQNTAKFMRTSLDPTTHFELSNLTVTQCMANICRFAMNQRWTLTHLNRVWSFGFHRDQLLTLLQRLPPPIVGCIADLCSSWEIILQAHSLESLKICFGCWMDTDEKYTATLHQNPLVCRLTMTFDASTQMRSAFTSNRFMSDILDLSHDDLDRRLAAHALPLPVCELDFVSLLLHQLLGGLTVPGVWRVSHLRLMPASGGRRRCVLVSWCSCAQVNDRGEVVEVRAEHARFLARSACEAPAVFKLSACPRTEDDSEVQTKWF